MLLSFSAFWRLNVFSPFAPTTHLAYNMAYYYFGEMVCIPFMVVTGSPEKDTVDVAFKRGVVAYLVKPFMHADVLEAIVR